MGVFCLFLLTFNNLLQAQSPEINNGYLLDRWDIENGLPANNVVDLLQSKNGYLWLVTFNGLVRFDGIRMKIFQTDEYPTLPSNRFNKIEESDDGTLWLTTEQGYLVKFKDNQFSRIDDSNGLNSDLVNAMTKDQLSTIWFATDEGIVNYSNETFKEIGVDDIHIPVGKIFPISDNELWFLNKEFNQVYRFSEGKLTSIDQLSTNTIPIESITMSPEGLIYLSVGDNIYYFKNNELHFHSTVEKNIGNSAAISFQKNGTMWVYTTSAGVFYHKNGSWASLPNSNHHRMNSREFFYEKDDDFWIITERAIWKNEELVASIPGGIYNFLFDYEGNLWIGTVADGILRIKANPFKTVTTADGLPSNNVYGIFEDSENHIWIGTHGAGTARLKNFEVLNTPVVLSSTTGGYMKGFYQINDSTLYAGSLGTSILEMNLDDPNFPYSKYTEEGIPLDINAFYNDNSGILWAGGSNGLFTLNNGKWNQITKYDGFDFGIKFFHPSPDSQSHWVATNGTGLLHIKKDTIEVYNTNNGFPTNHIRSLYIQENEPEHKYTLWIGSQDVGLLRLPVEDGVPFLEQVSGISTKDGLIDHTIHIILEDDHENLWMNTNQGIYRVQIPHLEAYLSGEAEKLKGVGYNEKDGLLNREGNGGVQPAGIVASDGNIWMASQEGAVVFHPENLISEIYPNVWIEEVSTNERIIINSTNNVTLSNSERDFEITFTALSLVNPEKNEYKYRLVGYNDTWQTPDILRKAIYTNIPNGTYTFEVLASNYAGNWTPIPARITIIVEPFFYETIWFLFLCIALFGVFIYSFIQWRLSTLRKNEIQLKELVNEKTKALQKEKKITEEQASRLLELDKAKTRFFTNISHELRTPLTLIISPLKRLTKSKEHFSEKTRLELERMLRNSDRLLRLVDQTLELTKLEHGNIKLNIQKIELFPFLEQLIDVFKDVASSKNIELNLQSEINDPILFADVDKVEKMVANLVSNALKFTPEGGTISVTIFESNGYYNISVSDTGIGISNNDLDRIFERFYQVDSSQTRAHEGSGIGLSLAKDFAKLHKGDLVVESVFGEGSTFTILLPMGSKHFTIAEMDKLRFKQTGPNIQPNYSVQTNTNRYSDAHKDDHPVLLIVEDNPDLRSFLCEIFESDFKVIAASNGEEGLKQVRINLPDLIIADIMMPVMDGFTFNQELKRDPQMAGIPLIFLTAKSRKDSEIKGLKEGADAYISKPFDPDILQNHVNNLLASRLRLRNLLQTESSTTAFSESKDRHPFLRKIDPIIEQHYSDPDFKVTQLAELLFMSRSQLLRTMKAACGESPSDYLKNVRIRKAKELLHSGEQNISEIAYATGFNSLSYFSFSFKENTGSSPTEYLSELISA